MKEPSISLTDAPHPSIKTRSAQLKFCAQKRGAACYVQNMQIQVLRFIVGWLRSGI